MLHKEIIRYDSTNIEKIRSSKEIIDINDIDIKLILVANKPNFLMYIVGYKNHNNITTLVIKLLKLKDFVKTFEETKTNDIYSWKKTTTKIWENYSKICNKVQFLIGKDFDTERIYKEKYLIKKNNEQIKKVSC